MSTDFKTIESDKQVSYTQAKRLKTLLLILGVVTGVFAVIMIFIFYFISMFSSKDKTIAEQIFIFSPAIKPLILLALSIIITFGIRKENSTLLKSSAAITFLLTAGSDLFYIVSILRFRLGSNSSVGVSDTTEFSMIAIASYIWEATFTILLLVFSYKAFKESTVRFTSATIFNDGSVVRTPINDDLQKLEETFVNHKPFYVDNNTDKTTVETWWSNLNIDWEFARVRVLLKDNEALGFMTINNELTSIQSTFISEIAVAQNLEEALAKDFDNLHRIEKKETNSVDVNSNSEKFIQTLIELGWRVTSAAPNRVVMNRSSNITNVEQEPLAHSIKNAFSRK